MDIFAPFDDLTTRLDASRSEQHDDSAPAVDTPVDGEYYKWNSPYLVCVIL
jgi:hypothetical protein